MSLLPALDVRQWLGTALICSAIALLFASTSDLFMVRTEDYLAFLIAGIVLLIADRAVVKLPGAELHITTEREEEDSSDE
jgi:predicted Co/Zn/Cd cation transporter (cation efflux family)